MFIAHISDIERNVMFFEIFEILESEINANRQNVRGPDPNPLFCLFAFAHEMAH